MFCVYVKAKLFLSPSVGTERVWGQSPEEIILNKERQSVKVKVKFTLLPAMKA